MFLFIFVVNINRDCVNSPTELGTLREMEVLKLTIYFRNTLIFHLVGSLLQLFAVDIILYFFRYFAVRLVKKMLQGDI